MLLRPTSSTFTNSGRPRLDTNALSVSIKPCSRGSKLVPSSSSTTVAANSVTLKYPGERDLNLAEYMVVLDKPLGLTLAPDPITGAILVQNIKEGSPAAASQLIQVGDVVKMCSAVFGEDMWQAIDIRRIRWAINNRTSKVKLVLERCKRSNMMPTWYSKGQVGRASVERDTLQLPVSFTTLSSMDDWSQDLVLPGRPMYVGFHRSVLGISQVQQKSSPAAARRNVRLQQLRKELAAARAEPEMDLTAAYSRLTPPSSADGMGFGSKGGNNSAAASNGGGAAAQSAGSNSSGSNNSGGGGQLERILDSLNTSSSGSGSPGGSSGAAATGRREKKVTIPVLPWLLATSGRLDTRDLTHLASYRGLGALLELGLTSMQGHLAVRGTDPALLTGELNSTVLVVNDAAAASSGPAPTGNASGSKEVPPSGQPKRSSVSTSPHRLARIRLLINAAASLHRLTLRRCGSLHHSTPEACAVLLHCGEGLEESQVAGLIAGWMHWYRRMPLQEALLSAELAMGCSVEQGLLEEATEYLVEQGEERMNKVVVTWKYGGLSVAVAGDIVNGWQNKVPLLRCKNPMGCKGDTARGNFFLELAGLRPGTYYYKFIVDGMWTVDPTAPKVLDTAGNYNNVLKVYEQQPIITSKERLNMARWHASLLALENKMGLPLSTV